MAWRSIARLQGSRGEGWVAAQTLLLLGSVAATFAGPVLPQSIRGPARLLGLAAIVGGGALFLAGALNLGESLTPLPRPKPAGTLVRTGAYRLVRHPIYGGVILAGVGWALFRGRWLGLAVSAGLLPFFDAKANLEETWLTERFPDYPAYRRRVRKLIPGLY